MPEQRDTSTLLLDGAAVRSLLDWPGALTAVEDAFVAAADGRALAGSASQLDPPGALLHLKAGGFSDPALLSVKANLRPHDGRAFGVVLVFDHGHRSLRAILDSADITAVRTAAAAAVAARALGARDGALVAVIGAGPVAARVLEALPHVVAPARVRLWSRDPERAAALAAAVPAGVAHDVASSPASAATGADLVITCTPSRAPLLRAADLAGTALVLAMGADSPGKQELAADVLDGAVVVSDDPASARRVGDSARLPRAAGDPVHLGAVLAGRTATDGTARVVFDSVGTAVADTAVAELVIRLATERGAGVPFSFGAG